MNRFVNHRRVIPFGVFALLLLTLPARAQEVARIPYKLIYQNQQTSDELGRTYTNARIYLALSSTLPDVKTSDLRIYIDGRNGEIPIALNSMGHFTVPLFDTFTNGEVWIISNQPKGTLQLHWQVDLIYDEIPTNGLRYAALMKPLKDVEAVRNVMIPGSKPYSIKGLRFIYPNEQEGTVVIHAKEKDRILKTDQTHTLVIPWEPGLADENPEIGIPIPPQKVVLADTDGDK